MSAREHIKNAHQDSRLSRIAASAAKRTIRALLASPAEPHAQEGVGTSGKSLDGHHADYELDS